FVGQGAGQTHQVRAFLQDSDVTDVTTQFVVRAQTQEDDHALTATIGASQSGMAAAVAVSVNSLSTDTESFIAGQHAQGTQASTPVSLTAEDSSSVAALAGGAVGAGSTDEGSGASAAGGAALAVNTINDTIQADLDHATVRVASLDLMA